MKTFSKEFAHNYKNYSFGYTSHCLLENGDEFSKVYSMGYLPHSGDPSIKNMFYMARSARVPLSSFTHSSENKRIAKKFDGLFSRKLEPIKNFNTTNEKFLLFCGNYFLERHGPLVMPRKRLVSILDYGLITNIITYSKNNLPVAYVFEVSDEKMAHFWFSFYDLTYVRQSLGMWLLLDNALYAKKRGADYFYIGTVYGEKSLYKTAFKNLEYWDGSKWVADIKQLKNLGRSDQDRSVDIKTGSQT